MQTAIKRIHFVGIGGIGMSGIAEVLHEQRFCISGSNICENTMTKRLSKKGIKIYLGHHGAHIKDAEVLVVSSAIAPDNPEITAAREKGIPIIPRAEMLGELMRFKDGIAIAGAHGKTTTTSLMATVYEHAGLDPSYVVGGVVRRSNTNAKLGEGNWIIVEADESDASFLHLHPRIAVVTNIDADHLENFQGNFDLLRQAYINFIHNIPFYGHAVLCFDDHEIRKIISKIHKPILSYGLELGAQYQAKNLNQNKLRSNFEVFHKDKPIGEFELALGGNHNVLNALAVIALAHRYGISVETIKYALKNFSGIDRRLQVLGEIVLPSAKKITLIDDYAHHPKEIEMTLEAIKKCWPKRRIIVVFQPHRYTRTRDHFDAFTHELTKAEELILMPVYPAQENPISGSESSDLCNAIRKRGMQPMLMESAEDLYQTLSYCANTGDIVLFLGAGDIGQMAKTYYKAYAK